MLIKSAAWLFWFYESLWIQSIGYRRADHLIWLHVNDNCHWSLSVKDNNDKNYKDIIIIIKWFNQQYSIYICMIIQ